MSPLRRGDEIRHAFLEFFRERGHTIVPSASLIPVDPTLLLTNAGMVPFKPFFLGEQRPPYRRATSVQKCLRTIDIDIVGTTARHATFFEMLGNFSFGDYFKEKAIPWAYEFVTAHLGLDPETLWFTIFEDDEEAAAIWIDGVGIPPSRLQRGSAAQGTFWQMGVPGPCGPSSEIFVDRGPAFGPEGGPNADEDRFLEIWNLVFQQEELSAVRAKDDFDVARQLPSKNIDSGAGLERIAFLLQGVDNMYEIDEIRPVIDKASELSGRRYGADPADDLVVQVVDETVIEHHAAVLQVVEHQHVVGPPVAVQRHPAHGVALVAALEQVQGEKAPVWPGQPLELRKVIKPGVVQGEWLGLEMLTLLADTHLQVEQPPLNGVDRQLAAVDSDPASAQLLGHGQGGT